MKIKALLAVATLSVSGFSYSGVENCATGNNSLTPTNFYKPSGYTLQYKQDGVCLYKKDGDDVYIQLVDLKSGATVKFGTGNYVKRVQLGHKNSRVYEKETLANHFSAVNSNNKLFSVVNGQFFGNYQGNAILSLPVKESSNEISGINDHEDWINPHSDYFRTLNIFTKSDNWLGKSMVVKPYPYFARDDFNNLPEKAIVGFHPTKVNKGSYTSRTFVAPLGGMTSPANREYPILSFIVTKKTSPSYVMNELKKWGASEQNIIMFDGGGSTQMKAIDGTSYYGISQAAPSPDYRSVPMFFEIYTH